MWGEGYDYVPLYSVSVGDLVGALPVGMMTRDDADAPYWPASNTFVFKEVWVHSSARWLALMQDVEAPVPAEPFRFKAAARAGPSGDLLITVEAAGTGRHSFGLRTDNLTLDASAKEVVLTGKSPAPCHLARPHHRPSRTLGRSRHRRRQRRPPSRGHRRTPLTFGAPSLPKSEKMGRIPFRSTAPRGTTTT